MAILTPEAIAEKIFEYENQSNKLSEISLLSDDKITLTDVTVDSTVGDDGPGKYAMVKGTLNGEEVGLKIYTKYNKDTGEIIDVRATGNVANPHLFEDGVAVTSVKE